MSGALPLLRAPPFPWVTAGQSEVSRVAARATGVTSLDGLVSAIREARVGGSFWGEPVEVAPGTLVVRAASAEAARRLLGGAGPRAPKLIVCPAGAETWGLSERIVAGEVDPWSLLKPGIQILADDEDEWRVIGAIAGATVRGRSVTDDEIAGALVGTVAYRNPFTGAAASPEEAIALLGEWRRQIDRNRGIAAAAGMAWWKKERIGQFLWSGPDSRPVFVEKEEDGLAAAAADKGALAVWPSRVTPDLLARARAGEVPIVRIEDGFVRSIGLGADLLPPFSIVIDHHGIYYDPQSGSDLERLLATADIAPALAERAERLAATMVEQGISKYGRVAPAPTAAPRSRRTVLVAGQVEDDQSVRTGGAGVAGNLDLLRRARAAEPEALILFKPHPDVDAGHRVGRIEDADALKLADKIVRNEPIQSLLARVDAVHVLTSLVGFEALLRRLETHVHGSPFYAGWGLTQDHGPVLPQRGRQRTLAELVACTLILYPRYQDPVTGLPCPPEVLLDRFAAGWKPRRSLLVFARRLQGRLFKLIGRATS